MEYLKLGNSDLKVSLIGLGAWQWGSGEWGWGKGYGKDDVLTAFNRALDLGINFIDTAEIYGNGASERIVGEAVRGVRDEVVIATKVSPLHLTYNGVLKAAKRSLRRLNISTIDLYQIHWPNPIVSIKGTMKAMEKLVKEGKIRYIGVSNFGLERLKKAQDALESYKIVSNQVKYNLLQRKIENDLLPYALKNDITIIAYSPLAQGLLSGRYNVENVPKADVRVFNMLYSPTNIKRLTPLMQVLRRVADERGKTVAQVALNWLFRNRCVVAIPGAKRASQIEECIGAVDWRLTKQELNEIEEAYRSFKADRILSAPRMLLRAILKI